MITQGAFNLLFRAGLRKDFRDTYQSFAPEFGKFLKTGTLDMPEISASIITGLSRMLERGDGEAITYEDPKMGPKVMATDKEFGLGFIITRKTVEDDQYGKANQASKWLANAAIKTQEYRSAGLLDDAFTGTTYKGIDGLALCSTAHTLINSGSTVSNSLATPVGLSMSGITSILDLAATLKDENGDPVVSMPNKLVIGNNAGDINRAIQIFGSESEPFTADNQINAIKKRLGSPETVVSHYKSSTKPWFMIDEKLADAWFLTKRALDFDDTFDFDTDAAKYKATMRFLIWFVDWRGFYGSNAT